MKLLTTDLHLTGNPNDEYRWAIFAHVENWILELPQSATPEIYILGDLCDRKDRHSAALVNRIADCLVKLLKLGASITILLGNHDKPINGPPFWTFLDNIKPGETDISAGIEFITEPTADGDILLLPFSDNPEEDWADIDFNQYKVALIHQTVNGAVGDNGFVLKTNKDPKFPRDMIVYSGDIHTTQKVGNVQYIGAPHPIDFGDSYPCQMVELGRDLKIKRTIPLKTIQKLMLRIDHPDDLERKSARKGDQVRVICRISLADVDKWAAIQDGIKAWAERKGVILFSIEPQIEAGPLATSSDTETPTMSEVDPAYILRLFADAEEIDDRMFKAGTDLLKETIG